MGAIHKPRKIKFRQIQNSEIQEMAVMPICLVRANSEPENALKIGPFVSIKGLFR